MTRHISIILIGVLFGAGLALSGMLNPSKVAGFLDLFGIWDPSLAFVMGGAVIVMAVAWRIVPRLAEPVFAGEFHLPTKSDLTPRLIGGAALFGIGWGIAGLCPGPGIAALVIEPAAAAIFVVAMLAGMAVVRLFDGASS